MRHFVLFWKQVELLLGIRGWVRPFNNPYLPQIKAVKGRKIGTVKVLINGGDKVTITKNCAVLLMVFADGRSQLVVDLAKKYQPKFSPATDWLTQAINQDSRFEPTKAFEFLKREGFKLNGERRKAVRETVGQSHRVLPGKAVEQQTSGTITNRIVIFPKDFVLQGITTVTKTGCFADATSKPVKKSGVVIHDIPLANHVASVSSSHPSKTGCFAKKPESFGKSGFGLVDSGKGSTERGDRKSIGGAKIHRTKPWQRAEDDESLEDLIRGAIATQRSQLVGNTAQSSIKADRDYPPIVDVSVEEIDATEAKRRAIAERGRGFNKAGIPKLRGYNPIDAQQK